MRVAVSTRFRRLLVVVAVAVAASMPGYAICVPDSASGGVTARPAGDAVRPDGRPWDPWGDLYSRQVFDSLDSDAVPPHVAPDFEGLKPSDRPSMFPVFLVLGAVLAPLALLAAAWFRRRRLAGWFRDFRPVRPDDAGWMLVIGGFALGARLAAVFLLPLHGAEWGSVELKPISRLPDVVFNGYEVLTNPPLLNLIEHFVFAISPSPVAFRIPIVLFGLALVWAARCTGRELFGRRAGIIAAAFCAVNCGLVVWSATMRAYLPMMTFIVAALPAAFRMARGDGRDRDALSLAIFGALAVWTHYIALLWLVCIFALVLAGRRRDTRQIARLAASGLFIALAFLPLVPFFLSDFGDKQGAMFPPGYAMHLLALATGLAFGAGLLIPAGLVAARFWRSGPALWLALLVGGYVALNVATSSVIFWEVSYSVGLAAVVMILTAGVIDRLSRASAAAVAITILLLSTSGLLLAEPSPSRWVSDATRPFLWRSVSNRMFADAIEAGRRGDGPGAGCGTVLVTPAFEAEPYLYYLGPVTTEQAGVEPIVVRNFDEMAFDVPRGSGRSPGRFLVIGFERYWSWYFGQWPELERFQQRFGTFWYARLGQDCVDGRGFTWSPWDCRWLAKNCAVVESTASDELYLCGVEARRAESDPQQAAQPGGVR